MKKGLIFTVMLVGVYALGFAQIALSGTYRYSANAYITFTGNNFTGSWNRTSTMSGTYSVSGSSITLNITGGTQARNTWNWTIIDANTLRDQDGDRWNKETTGRTAEDYINSGIEAFYFREDFDQAIADFTQAIRLKPDYLGYYYRGNAYLRNGDYDRAITDLTQAIRLSPAPAGYNVRGEAYLQKEDYDRAIADFTEAIRLGLHADAYANLYNHRGLAYEKKANWILALIDFITALRFDSRNDTGAGENLERILTAVPSLADARVLWTVNNVASWIGAVNGIRSGGENKVHIITISGNISVPMSNENTFGSVANVVVTLREGGTISPSSNGALLQIGNGQTVIVKDLTLRGRDANNSSIVKIENGGTFRMEGSATVMGNSTMGNSINSVDGGGVYVNGGRFIMLNSATVSGNIVVGIGGDGGGVYNRGTFYMSDSASVSGNTAYSGGGVYNDGTFIISGNATVSGNSNSSNINGNNSSGSGGGVFNRGNFYMWGSASVTGNSGSSGGGVHVEMGTFSLSENASVTGNNGGSGGGVHVYSGTFTMWNGTISGNTANSDGGGVNVYSEIFTMWNGIISGNTANRHGGGVYVRDGTFTMENGTISDNTTNSDGGGIYGNNFIMGGGTVSGNTAGGNGGGICTNTFTMRNGTISGNTARGNGGGVYSGRTFTMQEGIISGNIGSERGGGVYVSRGTLTKTSGTIYGNDADQELRNTIINRNGRGYAIYDNSNNRWRNATAGPNMNSDTYGFWLND
jgi:hypothetical protein